MHYFDIHNHILPGVDDGSADLKQSIDMLRLAWQEGIDRMVLTPHYMRNRNECDREELKRRFEELQTQAGQELPELKLYLGNEVLYEDGIVEDLKKGRIQTMNDTKYVLVEFLPQVIYSELYGAVHALMQARFCPILAHMERYHCLDGRLDRIEELLEMEVLLQMNVSSIDGGLFDRQAKWCRKLLKQHYIQFLGTDAHDMRNRAPYMQEYVTWIEKNCGQEYLQRIASGYPEKMICDAYI